MPLYEYQCRQCGGRFDFFSRLHELNREIRCPTCGAENPERVFSFPDEENSPDCASPGACLPRESS